MGDCIVTPIAATDFANRDSNRLIGQIAKILARKSPYMDVLDGGTIPNVSDTVRSVVQERAVMGQSLTKPVFVADNSTCGTIGNQAAVGSTVYSYGLQTMRGYGPKVCIKTTRTAFKQTYSQAANSLEAGILEVMNADIRSTLYERAGVKFVAKAATAFDTLLTGEIQAIDTPFYASAPDSAMTFKALRKLGAYMKEVLLAEPFSSDVGEFFKVITSDDQNEIFRNESGVKSDLNYLTSGRYDLGEKSLKGYSFQGPYRGFAFGIDPQPLRFSAIDGVTNQPVLLEPVISDTVTTGVGQRPNPAWLAATYEIGFIIGGNSFKRLVPEQYAGESPFKFSPQLHMGELKFHNIVDNDCNVWGDYGMHIYQISRAYQPMRPHCVIPFAYKRCQADLGFATCS